MIATLTKAQQDRGKQILATITLDSASEFAGQRGALYFQEHCENSDEGNIWCLLPDGNDQETCIGGFTRDEAPDHIQAAWGNGWDLEMAEEN